jgi:hypothetical protein
MSLPVGVDVSRLIARIRSRRALALDPLYDGQKIGDRTGEAIEFRHHKHVASADKVDSRFELCAWGDRRDLLGEDLLGARGAKLSLLSHEAGDLLDGACSGVSNDHGAVSYHWRT